MLRDKLNVFGARISVALKSNSHFYRRLIFFLQILAGDMSEANREACAAATRPLVNSVESLTAYALSPEFAPLPAKISEEVNYFYCEKFLCRLLQVVGQSSGLIIRGSLPAWLLSRSDPSIFSLLPPVCRSLDVAFLSFL